MIYGLYDNKNNDLIYQPNDFGIEILRNISLSLFLNNQEFLSPIFTSIPQQTQTHIIACNTYLKKEDEAIFLGEIPLKVPKSSHLGLTEIMVNSTIRYQLADYCFQKMMKEPATRTTELQNVEENSPWYPLAQYYLHHRNQNTDNLIIKRIKK
jgi:hypothetical protein